MVKQTGERVEGAGACEGDRVCEGDEKERFLEADVENLLISFPLLLGDDLEFVAKREAIKGSGIIDLVFSNKRTGKKVLVEVKRGSATRGDVGQVIDYFGALQKTNPEAEIVFVAKEIKETFATALSLLKIRHAEFSEVKNALIEVKKLRQNASDSALLRLQVERGDIGEASLEFVLKRLQEIRDHSRNPRYFGCSTGRIPVSVISELMYQVEKQLDYSKQKKDEISAQYALLASNDACASDSQGNSRESRD